MEAHIKEGSADRFKTPYLFKTCFWTDKGLDKPTGRVRIICWLAQEL